MPANDAAREPNDAARELALAALRAVGGCADAEGGLSFPPSFFVEGLRHSFGVFVVDCHGSTYRLVSLDTPFPENDDPQFNADMLWAKKAVKRGQGVAIVVASIVVEDGAPRGFTQLSFLPGTWTGASAFVLQDH